MKTIETRCKFCHCALNLEIDDDYDVSEREPLWTGGTAIKLLPLATCNRCADYITHQRLVSARIARACTLINEASTPPSESVKNKLRDLLVHYVADLARYRRVSAPAWEDSPLETIIANPLAFGSVLKHLRATVPQRMFL